VRLSGRQIALDSTVAALNSLESRDLISSWSPDPQNIPTSPTGDISQSLCTVNARWRNEGDLRQLKDPKADVLSRARTAVGFRTTHE
jgi:hypothetical protein